MNILNEISFNLYAGQPFVPSRAVIYFVLDNFSFLFKSFYLKLADARNFTHITRAVFMKNIHLSFTYNSLHSLLKHKRKQQNINESKKVEIKEF